eukprot:GSChrysophyteH1.ASY1.ANO1.415.1 assembled CDS
MSSNSLLSGCIRSVTQLGTPPFKTMDPFLFCYRMYHGERVPGFPSHPHRGFETVTATIDGLIDHCDSTGAAGRYGFGDNQWMTAGKGMQHSEMFPLINQSAPNPLRFFQIWLNLPAKSKFVDTAFVMHWGEEVPKVTSEDGLTKITIFAGELQGQRGLPPPPASWASTPENEVGIWHMTLAPGAKYELPAAIAGQAVNRQVYWIEGSKIEIGDKSMSEHSIVHLNAGVPATIENPGADVSEVLVLQGKPIGEPVVQHGPFVMNTQAEIQQAFRDYQQTQFGGWPWPSHDYVFEKNKGRFALQKGVETRPPQPQCAPEELSVKQLKHAITVEGLVDESKGFNEKREYVELLSNHQSKQR